MLEFLNGPGKRMIAAGIGALAIMLNKKLGLEVSEIGQAQLVALIVAFIGQSKWGEVAIAKGQAAAASVTDLKSAAAVLAPPP